MLSEKEKTTLLTLSRRTLEAHFHGKTILPFFCVSGELGQPRGAFVTLHKQGDLRGCIGRMESPAPLYQTIQQMTIAAAFEDPRFNPVEPDELNFLHIEISVLSPRTVLDDLSKIHVGQHGLSVSKGLNRGVLLPQVAYDHHWDSQTFLSQTCVKAGLPPDAWEKGGLRIEIFSAEVFGEKE